MLGLRPHFFRLLCFYVCLFVALSPDVLSSIIFTACLYFFFTLRIYIWYEPLFYTDLWVDEETGERYRIEWCELFPGQWRALHTVD